MPRRDGTGLMGMGQMSGRGCRRHFCVTGAPKFRGNNCINNNVVMDEKTLLKHKEMLLETQLKQVKDRLHKLDEETE